MNPLQRSVIGGRGDSVSDSESENKQRDRQIAHNEASREAVSAVRVSSWAIGVAVIAGVIAFAIVWAWLHR
jgi:flagellar biosynthesis/type III secretory pathway M-ring protein FliF/YscJ